MRCPLVTRALVLRSRSFGESDKIVSFLTESYGKVTGIAKGAKRSRKRFVNTLEPFALVNLRFQDRPHSSLAFIHACDLIHPFKDLTTNLEKIAHACYVMEMTDVLIREREENRALFEHLKEGLKFIEERGGSLSFLTFFAMKLLKVSGYEPMLKHCRRCKKISRAEPQNAWRFSPDDGGILCLACAAFRKDTLPLSVEALRVLSGFQEENGVIPHPSSVNPSILKEAQSVLRCFIQFQINKELKSAPFLEALSIA